MPTVTDEPTPKQPPDVAAVQTHQARPRRLRKNVIFGLMAILAGIAILAFSAAILETPTQFTAEDTTPTVANETHLPAFVKTGPKNYGEVPQPAPPAAVVQLGPAMEGDLGHAGVPAAAPPAFSPPPQATTAPEQQRLKDEFQAVLDGPIAVNLPIDTASLTRTPDTGGVTRRNVDPAVAALQALQGQQTGGAGVPDAGGHQAEKRAFLAQAEQKDKTFYVSGRLEDPVSPYELKSGAVIPCTMITGINSDLPGSLTCQVRQNVYDTVTGNYLLVPQGTKAVGEYDSAIVYGQERVLAVWHRLILPNGQSIDLEGMEGVDLSGYAGYTDRVDNHWKRLIGAVVLSSVFAAAPTATVGNGNSSDFNRPVGDEVARNIGANIQRAGDQIVSKNLNIQPTLMVGPGYAVNIFVKKDLVLAPYTVYRGSDIAFGRTANEPRRTLP